MVKFVLILLALVCMALGAVFLIIPEWYLTFSEAEAVNVGWLRGLGAGVITVQGFGLAVSAFRRRDTNLLVAIIALVSTVQAGVIWFSLFSGEFSAQAVWTIVAPGVLLTVTAFLVWAAWASRRRSVKLLNGGGAHVAPEIPHDAGSPEGPGIPL